MPVNSCHSQYLAAQADWKICRDVANGERAVKAAGVAYLPALEDQSDVEYSAYVKRAMFYGATARTISALTGAVLRRAPLTKIPKNLEKLLEKIGPGDESFVQVVKNNVEGLLTIGRMGILVDEEFNATGESRPDSLPYVVLYQGEAMINWSVDKSDGTESINWVVLEELVEVGTDDPFVNKEITQWRLLFLKSVDGKNQYWQRIYDEVEQKDSTTDRQFQIRAGSEVQIKKRGGRPWEEIPFIFVNPSGISADIEKPPLLDLANVNLSHYRTSADLEHGRHFTALPTAFVAGFDPKETKLKIGSSQAWVAQDTNAHANYLEFSGAGLGQLSQALKEKEGAMVTLGARLLEESRPGVESAESIRIRYAGEKSSLVNICRSLSQALTKALRFCADWVGETDLNSIETKVNEDYGISGVSPQVIQIMLTAVMSGHYPKEAWAWFLRNNDFVPEDLPMPDLIAQIEQDVEAREGTGDDGMDVTGKPISDANKGLPAGNGTLKK